MSSVGVGLLLLVIMGFALALGAEVASGGVGLTAVGLILVAMAFAGVLLSLLFIAYLLAVEAAQPDGDDARPLRDRRG